MASIQATSFDRADDDTECCSSDSRRHGGGQQSYVEDCTTCVHEDLKCMVSGLTCCTANDSSSYQKGMSIIEKAAPEMDHMHGMEVISECDVSHTRNLSCLRRSSRMNIIYANAMLWCHCHKK